MSNSNDREGGCACGRIRYKLNAAPLIVHACHCRDCQRMTGGAFVINLWIEKKFVAAKGAVPKSFRLAGGGGKPHDVFFCGECGTYLWSHYHGAPGDALFVRAGTLDDPSVVRPDVHIFTRSKLPWLELPQDTPAFETFYNIGKVWPPASRERARQNLSWQID
ncbi:MAG: GFA family protein [Candidatus Binataceae bacterium]